MGIETTTLFGQDHSKNQVFAGLYLLAGGLVVGIAGIIVFLMSTSGGQPDYGLREGALALGSIAVVAFFMGVSVALPSNRAMRIASFIGMAVCAVGIILFMIDYPFNFNVQGSEHPDNVDHTARDTLVFAVGLAIIVSGSFMSVVGYYVHRLAGAIGIGGNQREVYEDEFGHKTYEVPDWVIEKDLEDAMKNHGVSLGLGDDRPQLRVNVRDDMEGAVASRGHVNVIEIDGGDNDRSLDALVQMRPSNRNKAVITDEEVVDPVEALKAFRKQVKANPKDFQIKQGVFKKKQAGPRLGNEE